MTFTFYHKLTYYLKYHFLSLKTVYKNGYNSHTVHPIWTHTTSNKNSQNTQQNISIFKYFLTVSALACLTVSMQLKPIYCESASLESVSFCTYLSTMCSWITDGVFPYKIYFFKLLNKPLALIRLLK